VGVRRPVAGVSVMRFPGVRQNMAEKSSSWIFQGIFIVFALILRGKR